MTKNNAGSRDHQQPPAPDSALKRLEKLVGIWEVKGRMPGATVDNITGWTTFEWMPGEFFLKSSSEITFRGFTIQSLEIIAYDPTSSTFPSSVYTNMSGAVLPYAWDVQGNTVTHWIDAAKYTGTFSDDGRILTGGWGPAEGNNDPENVAYDAVMTRRK